MKREEAYKLPLEWNTIQEPQTKILIDKIYNDFESRTCENCYHFIKRHGDCFILPIDINTLPEDFACSKWEKIV